MTELRITPQRLDRKPAVAMQLAGRIFSECPNCSNVYSQPERVYSQPERVTLPVEYACRCGQVYTVTLIRGEDV